MTFKLPTPPSPRAGANEVADFAELLAWQRGEVSARHIVRVFNQADDNLDNLGCEDEEARNSDFVDDAFGELEKRSSICGASYPYRVSNGSQLQHDKFDLSNRPAIIYRYLLLCTRLNMKNNSVHAELNGTHIFEELTASVLKSYLGASRAKSMVFGTSAGSSFSKKVKRLCAELNEGYSFDPIDESGDFANDGKLDSLVWVPFADKRPGQVILFAQSKTGTSWKDDVTKSRPEDFAKKYLRSRFFWVNPVRAFCVAESIESGIWLSHLVDGGLLLDRCRLVEFSDNIEDTLFNNIFRWTQEAKESTLIETDQAGTSRPRAETRRPRQKRRP